MKIRNILCLLLTFLLFMLQTAYAAPEAPDIKSQSVVVMDASTGQVIYKKEPVKKSSPASLTKILASLVILENSSLNNDVTIEQSVIDAVANTRNIGLIEGEVLPMKDLVYGMLMQSANDCAVSAAASVSGSTEGFVKLMNEKAKELGAKNTHFSNVTGLHADTHYTTAEDMAIILSHAMNNAEYMEIAGEKNYVIPLNEKVQYTRTLTASCNLLSAGENGFNGINSGVYGYTDQGRYTGAITASKNGFNIICIVMGAPDESTREADIKSLINYSFDNFQTVTINPEDVPEITSPLKGLLGKIGEVEFKLPSTVVLTAPKNATANNIQYVPNLNKSYKKQSEYSATVELKYENELITTLNFEGTASKKITFYNIIKTILIIILVVILLFIALCAYYIIDSERKRKKRKQNKIKRTLRIKKDI